MMCSEAAEFVSALFDGETITRAAAEHINNCDVCGEQLRQYAQMSVELRRAASLDFAEEAAPRGWDKPKQTSNQWWQKGMDTMRIPRFAFASLVAGVLILSSSLAMVGVRAHSEGNVVALRVALPSGDAHDCMLSAVDKKWQQCAIMGVVNHGLLNYRIDLLSKDGDRAELAFRASFTPFAPGVQRHTTSLNDLARLPQQNYTFEPGTPLQLDVPGLGKLPLTGEWTDHIPSVMAAHNHDLDPGPSELRFISPIFVEGKQVLADLSHVTEISDQPDQGVAFYEPGLGRYVLSLTPLKNSIEGNIKVNRISFEEDHRSYTFITGTPVARAEHIWIQHDANFKPQPGLEGGFNGVDSIRDQMVQPVAKE